MTSRAPLDRGRAEAAMVEAGLRLGLCVAAPTGRACALTTVSDTRDDALGARTIVARCATHGVLRPVSFLVSGRRPDEPDGLAAWRGVAFLSPRRGRA